MFKPVRKLSVSDAVFEQLRDQITSGQMASGSQLPGERVLSETLGVNRGAIREALKRLSQAGLVSIQHGGGTRVLDFRSCGNMGLLSDLLFTSQGEIDADVARSTVEMRFALAPHIARLAARRSSADIEARLEKKLEELLAASNSSMQSLIRRWEFWDILVEASGNVAYQLAFNTLGDSFQRTLPLLDRVLAPVIRDPAPFFLIARAVVQGDEEAAEQMARQALRPVKETILAALEPEEIPETERAIS